MPFYRVKGMRIHMRGTKLPDPCAAVVGIADKRYVCEDMSRYLCDWPVGGGRSCDKALCEAHAHQVGPNKHYCPEHLAEYIDGQSDLFSGVQVEETDHADQA
ncbi:MAG: hypothetical protein KF796_20600 [Ramlibacter sp.]|nr:hypothetical protein [Ramlibacter sp.]